MAQLEKDVKKKIKALILKLWPNAWHLMVVPGGFGTGGVPDHLAGVPIIITPEMVGKTYAMLVAVEAKAEGRPLRGLQRITIAKIIKIGGFAAVVKGVGEVAQLEKNLRRVFCLK